MVKAPLSELSLCTKLHNLAKVMEEAHTKEDNQFSHQSLNMTEPLNR